MEKIFAKKWYLIFYAKKIYYIGSWIHKTCDSSEPFYYDSATKFLTINLVQSKVDYVMFSSKSKTLTWKSFLVWISSIIILSHYSFYYWD